MRHPGHDSWDADRTGDYRAHRCNGKTNDKPQEHENLECLLPPHNTGGLRAGAGRLMLRSQLLRYCLVGAVNTLTHFLLLIGLVEKAGLQPALANVLAFVLANMLSFVWNSLFTFASKLGWQRYLKFLAVSLIGLAISYYTVNAATALGWHYLIGAAIGIAINIAVGFVLSKKLVFGS